MTIPATSTTAATVWLATATATVAAGAAAMTHPAGMSPRDAIAVPWRAARAGVAFLRARRQARRDWTEGAELVRGVVALRAEPDPEVGSQPRCPRCGGRRCGPHRAGLDCGPQRAPSLTTILSGGGMHERAAVLRRWVERDWSPLSWDLRLWLAPARYERRLPAVIV